MADETFSRGAGCDQCNGLGIKGRRMAYELLTMSATTRTLIAEGVNADRIDEQAISDGMVPLTQHALQLAREGIIALSEVYRTRLD